MKFKKINLSEQTISIDELDSLANWIKTNPRLTKGELTEKFESNFSHYIKKKYSVFVNSGSSANLLIALSLKESKRLKNNIVIAPAVSWATTVSPFLQFGFDVHLCDCNLTNLGVDLSQLEKLCKKFNPSVIVICNVLGHPNDFIEIQQICDKHNIILVEDNCESLGSEFENKMLGSFGLLSSHSFYYGHHISTIEGGMISTDDEEVYNLLLSMRSHGWNRDITPSYKKNYSSNDSFRDIYTFYHPGLNVRSTDLNAFLGINQLKKINNFAIKRQDIFNNYKSALNEFWSQSSNSNMISSFAYGTLVKNPSTIYRNLANHGIESRPLICGNIARHPFWKKGDSANFPNANIVHDFGIYLPIHTEMNYSDVQFIANTFKSNAIPY